MMVVMMTMVTTTALRTMVATQTQFLNPNPTTIEDMTLAHTSSRSP